MTDAALRINLPTELDEQQMRSALDRSLQLIALDIVSVAGAAMQEHYGEGWMRETCERTGHSRIASDPIFWIEHFKLSHSPVFKAVPWLDPGARSQRLEGMRRVRNYLFHYNGTYDVKRTRSDLHTLLAVARGLDLACQDEIQAVRDHLHLLLTGDRPPSPTAADAAEAARTVEMLQDQLVEAAREKDVLRRQVDEAYERLAAAVDDAADSEADRQTVRDLEATVQRLQDEVESRTRHEAILGEHLDRASEIATSGLPPAVEQGLRSAAEYVNNAQELLSFLVGHMPHGPSSDIVKLSGDLRDFLQGSSAVVRSIPMAPRVAETGDLEAAALRLRQAATSTRGLLGPLLRADVAVRDASDTGPGPGLVAFVRQMNSEWENLVQRFSNAFDEVLSIFVETGPHPNGSTDETVELPEAGGHWAWQRGSEVWVLSARHQRLHRPRSQGSDDFAALYGAAQERVLVRQWLSIRPEGGRIYIDEDGDACTLGHEGRDIYLGRVHRKELTSRLGPVP